MHACQCEYNSMMINPEFCDVIPFALSFQARPEAFMLFLATVALFVSSFSNVLLVSIKLLLCKKVRLFEILRNVGGIRSPHLQAKLLT